MINIVPLPALKDNYIWAIHDDQSPSLWIVDPGEADPVIEYIQKTGFKLEGILVTHHHWDHTNGLEQLQKTYPMTPIYGASPEQVPQITRPLKEGDFIPIPDWDKRIETFAIPGHTLDHTAYLLGNALFCGDTLFAGGCGRIFEGTPEMMLNSLNKIKGLPDNTLVYCGHEYTLANLIFALKADPHNKVLQQRFEDTQTLLQTQTCTLPSLLSDERATNPFLRSDSPDIQTRVSEQMKHTCHTALDCFAALREWKNNT